jgi:hypothetical protein
MTQRPSPAKVQQAQLHQAAVAFGISLMRWRRRQGWTQATAAKWAAAVGRTCVFSSQWSNLENATMKNPGPPLFMNLGSMNRDIACQNYGPIRDRSLMDRVKAATPVVHPDGEPWDGADFFAAYIGIQPWPNQEPEAPLITDEDAAAWSATLRDWFQQTVEAAGLEPLDAAVAAMRHANPDRGDHKAFQRLILGFEDLSAAWLLEQWQREAESPVQWLAAWRQELGLEGDAPTPQWEK